MSETRTDRLEADIADIKATLRDLVPVIHRIDATLPHLATKAELTTEVGKLTAALAEKPSRAYLWGVMAAIFAAQAVALAAFGVILAALK
jgi:hypothetical protein